MRSVVFVDTSVLCELLEVPGKNQQAAQVREEFARRVEAGERFVIPITAVIETGNHIAHVKEGPAERRSAAERFVALLRSAVRDEPPFTLNQVDWNRDFAEALCGGDSTQETFVDLAGSGRMGSGDVAVLVERDLYVERTAMRRSEVRIWTLENQLRAYS